MLFAVKRQVGPALGALLALLAAALGGGAALGLDGPRWSAAVPGQAAAALGVLLASDAVLQGALWLGLVPPGRARYREGFAALAAYFRGQGPAAMAAGALLAAGEELFFRGLLVRGLIDRGGLPPAPAVAAAALLFGAAHRLPDRRLRGFALWAVWEGALLGTLYLYTGSLAAVALAHALHDLGGFAALALFRRLSPHRPGRAAPPSGKAHGPPGR